MFKAVARACLREINDAGTAFDRFNDQIYNIFGRIVAKKKRRSKNPPGDYFGHKGKAE